MSLHQYLPEMIEQIIDDNVERIESDLKSRGLSYDRLLDDLLDHVCCLVEEEMQSGKDFELSYSRVMDSIGEDRLPEIEHQTLLLLNKKFQRMKKTTYLIGLLASFLILFGSFSKRMHWPLTGIELSLGLFAIIFVFLPLYFIVTYREQTERKNIVYPIVGYLTIALLLSGAVFKVQHWQGADNIFTIGMAIMIIGFVPLYIVNAFQKAKGKKGGLPYIIMVVVGIAIVSLISGVKMSKVELDIYRDEAIQNELRVKEIESEVSKILSLAPDSSIGSLMMVHNKAHELQSMIDDMLGDMLVNIKEPGVSLESLQKLDRTGIGRAAIIDNGWAGKFMTLSEDYQNLLMEQVDDQLTRNQIGDHLEYIGNIWSIEWGPKDLRYDPLIKIYYKHTDISKGIALSEYVAINYMIQD